jgi:hypothetical protein
MKKFTLIEADRYISIDGTGIFFTEDKWPFADIEHLWAIQWKDDGTPEGTGEVEYDSPVPNTPATRDMITRYVDHFEKEKAIQEEERKKVEEEQSNQSLAWSTVMQELESQMEEMQSRHEQAIKDIQTEADSQIDEIHRKVSESHEQLFYASDQLRDNVLDSANAFEQENNPTLFSGNVDPSLFDDSVDPSLFDSDGEEDATEDSDVEENNTEESDFTNIVDFSNLDLSVLEEEFNLEMLFDDEPEQIVPEIEEANTEE